VSELDPARRRLVIQDILGGDADIAGAVIREAGREIGSPTKDERGVSPTPGARQNLAR
jgi:hypothetical protein